MKIDKGRRIMFFVSLIGIIIVTFIMGTTFAYQTLVVDYKEGSNNNTLVESGKLNVSYENNNKITIQNMPLLPDYKTADYTEFTIKTNDSSYDIAYQINLTNLEYSNSFISENFKYTLTLVENEEEFVIGTGDFSSLSGTEINLPFTMNSYRILEKGKTETLRLYLWLKESEISQNFEAGRFTGTIEIVSLFSNETRDIVYKTLKINGTNSILPNEYQEVEHIESSGNQYIDMQYGYIINDEINIKFMKTQDTGAIQGIFGNGNSVNYTGSALYVNESNVLTATIGGNLENEFYNYETDTLQNNRLYTLKYNQNNVYLDNRIIITVNNTLKNATQTDFSLFRRYNTNGMYGRIYSFNIKRNNSLIFDMIPCYRKSDNIVGMYDLVNSRFYQNSGSGEFVKGANIEDYVGEYDVTNNKYKITLIIKVNNEIQSSQDIYLNEPLRKYNNNYDYIDLINGRIVRNIKVVNSVYSELEQPQYEKIEVNSIPYIENSTLSISYSNNIYTSNIEIETNK